MAPPVLSWVRLRYPDEHWHRHNLGDMVLPCGLSMVGREVVQVSVVEPAITRCDHAGCPMLHVDLWPSRVVCGRVPLCLGCAASAWRECVGP